MVDKYDYIVIGSGILSVCFVNMLVQAGKRVLVIRINNYWDLGLASMQNQAILNSGVPWFFDKSDVVLGDFYRSFEAVKGIMGINKDNIKSYCLLSQSQGSAYLKKAQEMADKFAEFSFPDSVSKNGKVGSDFLNRFIAKNDLVTIPIFDTGFKIDRLMNMLEDWSIDPAFIVGSKYGSVEYKNVENHNIVRLESLEQKIAGIRINSELITAANIVLCSGIGTFNLLNPLYNNQIELYEFKDGSTFGGKPFKFAIERMPVLTLEMEIFMENVIFNLDNRDAFVKHPKGPVIYTTTNKNVISETFKLVGDINTDGDEASLKSLKEYLENSYELTKGHYSLIKESHCNKLVKSCNGTQSISSFVQKMDGFDNLYIGFPGKASLAFTAAEKLLALTGITSIDGLIGGDPTFANYKHQLIHSQ